MKMSCNHWFSGKDQPCGWRISPFGAKLEIAGKKSFLWSHPCFQAHHLETYADTAKAKFVDFWHLFLATAFLVSYQILQTVKVLVAVVTQVHVNTP